MVTDADVADLEMHVAECDVCSAFLSTAIVRKGLTEKLRSAFTSVESDAGNADTVEFHRDSNTRHADLSFSDGTENHLKQGNAALADTFLAAGTILGRYRIEQTLGHGGMAVVYLAFDSRLGRKVAIKIPRSDLGDWQQSTERFDREARAMALVSHRNLCPIYDVDVVAGHHLLAMAFIDGEPLSIKLVRGEQFTMDQIAVLIMKLAFALEKAHAAQVIHRDLKPANIMIDREGEPILMDFGLARPISEMNGSVTHSGTIVGTPMYMAPEHLSEDATQVGPWSDQYSLGAVLYELLAGQPMHTGSIGRILARLAACQMAPKPSTLRSGVSPSLEVICLKATSPHPRHRYSTVREMGDAIRNSLANSKIRLSDGFSVPERSVGRNIPCGSKVDAPGQRDSSSNGRRSYRLSGNRRWLLLIITAISMLAAIVLIRSGNSEFVIETNSTEIAQRLDQDGGIVLEDLNTQRKYRLKRGSNLLPNGDYDLQLKTPDGLELETNVFKLTRFGSVIATVRAKRNIQEDSGTETATKATAESAEPANGTALGTALPGSHSSSQLPWQWLLKPEQTSPPVKLGPEINSEQNNCSPTIAADGLVLAFNRTRDGLPILYESRRDQIDQPFGPPVELPEVINLPGFVHDCPSLSSDGLTLWYSSNRPGTRGERDLWVSHRESLADSWSKPINLGEGVNTDGFEQTPFVTEDGLSLIFSRRVFGNFRMFQARRTTKAEPFSMVHEITQINDGVCSSCPMLTSDQLMLIFVHCRAHGDALRMRYATRSSPNSEFSAAQDLNPVINDATVVAPSLSSDGQTFYFASQRSRHADRFELWYVTRRSLETKAE